MELHTDDFPLSLNRKSYDYLIENFKAIEQAINNLRGEVDKLKRSDVNTEYITDTSIQANEYDVPMSVDINDTIDTANNGLQILENKH